MHKFKKKKPKNSIVKPKLDRKKVTNVFGAVCKG